jgi:hypothetical protein
VTARTSIQPQPLVADPPRYTDLALPPYRFVPGGPWPHPVRDPAGHMYGGADIDEPVLPPERWAAQRSYLYGVDLFNHAYWWEAHEAWEDIWKRTDDRTQQAHLHGLIHLGAALLKWHLRMERGVRVLLGRSRRRLGSIAEAHGVFMGLDVDDLLATIAASRLAQLPQRPAIMLRLRG